MRANPGSIPGVSMKSLALLLQQFDDLVAHLIVGKVVADVIVFVQRFLQPRDLSRIVNGAKLQLAAYQERERQIEDQAELVGQLKKVLKSSTTLEALYQDKLGKTQKQRFLHQFITRIDVGTSFLTVHWSFKEGKGTKIARSLVTSPRGKATRGKCSIGTGSVGEEAG